MSPERNTIQTAKDKNLWNHKHTSKHNRNIKSTGKWELWQAETIKNNHAYIYINIHPQTIQKRKQQFQFLDTNRYRKSQHPKNIARNKTIQIKITRSEYKGGWITLWNRIGSRWNR